MQLVTLPQTYIRAPYNKLTNFSEKNRDNGVNTAALHEYGFCDIRYSTQKLLERQKQKMSNLKKKHTYSFSSTIIMNLFQRHYDSTHEPMQDVHTKNIEEEEGERKKNETIEMQHGAHQEPPYPPPTLPCLLSQNLDTQDRTPPPLHIPPAQQT